MDCSFSQGNFDDDDFESEIFRIDNPLCDLQPEQLFQRADEFAKLVSKEHPDGFLARCFKTVAHWARLSRGPVLSQNLDRGVNDNDELDKSLIVLFRKAAQVAQNPRNLGRLNLSDYERRILNSDREVQFWDQPKMLRVTVVTLCFSAIVQGWIQSGANGANQNWPSEFKLITKDGAWSDDQAKWIYAGVNAIPYLSASFFGCWLSDPLQSMVLGRRGAIFASALLCFASLIGSACVHNWQQLMVCRALVGLGLGAKASVTPIFGAETSPSHLRGALVMNWQLFDTFGIFLGFTANVILLRATEYLSWRLQFASACIPAACLLTLVWTIPESPRWLLKQSRHREAFKALVSLRESELQAAVELFYANAQLQIETKMQPQTIRDPEKDLEDASARHVENADAYADLNRFQNSVAMTNYFSRFLQLFRDPRTRRSTVAASVVMISQQLCGINVLAFYSSTIFRDLSGRGPGSPSASSPSAVTEQDRASAVRAIWLSWGFGLANFVFTIPAYYLIDTKGRRFLLFCTYPGMILSMLAACLSFLNPDGVEAKVAVFMFIFVFFYSWGQGPVAFAYSSEVFPLINREAGMSFAVFINLLGAGILTLLVPLAQTSEDTVLARRYNVGQARLLGIFVGFNVLALILIFFLVPETAGATIRQREEDDHLTYMKLEELNYIFGAKTRNHVSYQTTVMIPYAAKMGRWRLCRWLPKKFRYSKPKKPKKMWVWAELKEMREKGPDESETTLSSGADQTGGQRDSGQMSRVSQRNGVQVLTK